jgi:hypothetical protein
MELKERHYFQGLGRWYSNALQCQGRHADELCLTRENLRRHKEACPAQR